MAKIKKHIKNLLLITLKDTLLSKTKTESMYCRFYNIYKIKYMQSSIKYYRKVEIPLTLHVKWYKCLKANYDKLKLCTVISR